MTRIKKEKRENIVFVTADKKLGEIYSSRMQKYGFDVKVISKGEKALKYIHEKHPACVILDADIPGEDGIGFILAKKEDSSCGSIPVIVLANSGNKDDVDVYKKVGGVEHYYIKNHAHPLNIIKGIKELLNRK